MDEELGKGNWYNRKRMSNIIKEENFLKTDIFTFLKNYSLYESTLIDIISESEKRDLMLAFYIDPFFDKEFEKFSSTNVLEFPVLLLYFPKVKSIQINYDANEIWPLITIYKVETNDNKNNEFVETKIISIYKHDIKILHTKDLHVALFDKDGNNIKLNKL